MSKWIWTFGGGTKYAGKYIVVNSENGDGREHIFEIYGQGNCAMSYPYNVGIKLAEKYKWDFLEELYVWS